MDNSKGRAGGKAARRLRRLLAVVPYVVSHPGVKLQELSGLFGVQEKDLVEDLNLLFVSGLPPYGPGDLIDVQIEEGRVWIAMADFFARPVRLTRSEALALYLKGKALLGAPGLQEAPHLVSALAKLEEGLGSEALGDLAGRVQVEPAGKGVQPLAEIRGAIEARQRLRIQYYSATRDELTDRRIDPEHLFSALGNWYVVAWDHSARDERLFRADRIQSVEEVGESFEPRGLLGPGRALYTRSAQDITVRLLLNPAARWVAEYYEVESSQERQDGALEVVIPTKDLSWIAKLLLRLGGEATVLWPSELEQRLRETASRTLELYETTQEQTG